MPTLIVVRRYDNPDRFGLHTNEPYRTLKEGVYWTIGLFSSKADLNERLADYGVLTPSSAPLEDLIKCAPIEWHSAMRNGEMLERFQVFTTNKEA